MNLLKSMQNFLYDKDYFITIYQEYIHVYGFKKIMKINDSELFFEFENFDLFIKGEKLLVKKLLKNEILVSGNIKSFNILDEKTSMD